MRIGRRQVGSTHGFDGDSNDVAPPDFLLHRDSELAGRLEGTGAQRITAADHPGLIRPIAGRRLKVSEEQCSIARARNDECAVRSLNAVGRDREAAAAYDLAETGTRLLAAHGVRTELDSALLALDRDRNVREALVLAQTAHRRAPILEAEDVLAWAVYKNDRREEAERHSLSAMRLGTGDPLVRFQHGMIQPCLGDEEEAKEVFAEALAANPHFSLKFAPVARDLTR